MLAAVFLAMSNFTGFGDENVGFLDALGSQIDPRGLLLAGIVIGSLGVLDDVTVTQVSAVWELKRATPDATFAELYGRALRIGRDHISSTVNTLFLAYAGASLPLLLLFSEAQRGPRLGGDPRDRGRRDRPSARRVDRAGRLGADQHGAGCQGVGIDERPDRPHADSERTEAGDRP